MSLTQPELKGLAQSLSMMIDAIDQGMTPERMRDGLVESGLPAKQADSWFNLAAILHEAIQNAPQKAPAPVTNPGYRKGTAMKPATWADCLWQPPK